MRGFNSTIQRKKKRCSVCGKMEYIFSKGRCEACARVQNAQATDEIEEDTESIAILKKDVDILFSRLVRMRAANPESGFCSCYICDYVMPWTQAQAMHYVHREDSSLRFHPKNVKCGCKNCNVYLDGNLIKYAERLELEEKGITEWLYLEGKQPYKFSREELKQMIADFSREIRILSQCLKGVK